MKVGCSQYHCILVKGNSELGTSFTLESAMTKQQITFSQRKSPFPLQNVASGEMKEASAQRMGNVILESLVPEILDTYKQWGREGWEWTQAL